MISRLKYIIPLLIISVAIGKIYLDHISIRSNRLQSELTQLTLKETKKLFSVKGRKYVCLLDEGTKDYVLININREENRQSLDKLHDIYKEYLPKIDSNFNRRSLKMGFESFIEEAVKIDTAFENHFRGYDFDSNFPVSEPSVFAPKEQQELYQQIAKLTFQDLYNKAAFLYIKNYFKKCIQKIRQNAIIQPVFRLEPLNRTPSVRLGYETPTTEYVEFSYIFAMPFDRSYMKFEEPLEHRFDKKGFLIMNPKDIHDSLEVKIIVNDSIDYPITFEKPRGY